MFEFWNSYTVMRISFTSLQSIIRCQAKAAVIEVLEFISECNTVPAYKDVSLNVFNSWVTFELPVQESALLVGKYLITLLFT